MTTDETKTEAESRLGAEEKRLRIVDLRHCESQLRKLAASHQAQANDLLKETNALEMAAETMAKSAIELEK